MSCQNKPVQAETGELAPLFLVGRGEFSLPSLCSLVAGLFVTGNGLAVFAGSEEPLQPAQRDGAVPVHAACHQPGHEGKDPLLLPRRGTPLAAVAPQQGAALHPHGECVIGCSDVVVLLQVQQVNMEKRRGALSASLSFSVSSSVLCLGSCEDPLHRLPEAACRLRHTHRQTQNISVCGV